MVKSQQSSIWFVFTDRPIPLSECVCPETRRVFLIGEETSSDDGRGLCSIRSPFHICMLALCLSLQWMQLKPQRLKDSSTVWKVFQKKKTRVRTGRVCMGHVTHVFISLMTNQSRRFSVLTPDSYYLSMSQNMAQIRMTSSHCKSINCARVGRRM